MGTSSWRIVNKHREQGLVSVANFVPGRGKNQSSYRSELMGMLGIIVFVHLVTEFFHLEEGQIEVTSDGIEALKVISEEYKSPKKGDNS
jgi:hypothetical protein